MNPSLTAIRSALEQLANGADLYQRQYIAGAKGGIIDWDVSLRRDIDKALEALPHLDTLQRQLETEDIKKAFIQPGMTLRDYFAAKAMQGILAHSCDQAPNYVNEQALELASRAFEMADAMIAKRNK